MAGNPNKLKSDPLAVLRRQVRAAISEQYPTVEKFCYENDFHKSTISRFLNGERLEYKITTLAGIAEALGKKFVVKIE